MRSNVGDNSPPASVRATGSRESTDFESFRIDLSDVDLNAGDNVLALHVLNRSVSNNDLLAVPTLYGATLSENELTDEVYFTLDGSDPRGEGGGVEGSRFGSHIQLEQDSHVMARSYKDGEWSALTEAVFSVGSLDGDFNSDNQVDNRDIDLLFAAIRSSRLDLRFDLTGDSEVDEDDRDFLVQNILGTSYGDANLDGVFNSSDLVQVFDAGKFEFSAEDEEQVAGWSQGDWDGDGVFGTRDLVLAFQRGSYNAAGR